MRPRCNPPHPRAVTHVHAALGDAVLHATLLAERLAKRDAVVNPSTHPLQGSLAHAKQPHAVVNAAWTKATLRDLEAAARACDDGAGWQSDVVKHHLRMAVRGIVKPDHAQRANDLGQEKETTPD